MFYMVAFLSALSSSKENHAASDDKLNNFIRKIGFKIDMTQSKSIYKVLS